MSKLLLPLETLGQKHSDVVIRELASNLRAVIATHGAYQPENLTAASQPPRNPETVKSNSVTKQKKHKLQAETNISQTKPHSCPGSNSPGSTHSRHAAPPGGSVSGINLQHEGRTSGTSSQGFSTKPFTDWLLEACDPDVPTRALALRILTQRVKNGDPEAVQAQEKVFTVRCLLLLFHMSHLLQRGFAYVYDTPSPSKKEQWKKSNNIHVHLPLSYTLILIT